ncbi:hypothetical protein WUBG_17649 [Wuchereria bancrofti]|uniref:Uncharacterized protein n=1 Tax=Wuchereria bancrofti TaxID=6293 RepID=J9E7U0_WUCBA|nr:hypothetical protein WUBG_17649 [Wuchereria bancrofti]
MFHLIFMNGAEVNSQFSDCSFVNLFEVVVSQCMSEDLVEESEYVDKKACLIYGFGRRSGVYHYRMDGTLFKKSNAIQQYGCIESVEQWYLAANPYINPYIKLPCIKLKSSSFLDIRLKGVRTLAVGAGTVSIVGAGLLYALENAVKVEAFEHFPHPASLPWDHKRVFGTIDMASYVFFPYFIYFNTYALLKFALMKFFLKIKHK